jgi:hypothetical protein
MLYDFYMTERIYVGSITSFLLLSSLAHIFFQSRTKYGMSKPGLVRSVGASLILLSVPCLLWRGWYFLTLFTALVVSGAWRFFFPQSSIRAQERTYPRWVHGCLLLGGAIAVCALRPSNSIPDLEQPRIFIQSLSLSAR